MRVDQVSDKFFYILFKSLKVVENTNIARGPRAEMYIFKNPPLPPGGINECGGGRIVFAPVKNNFKNSKKKPSKLRN